ncbi:hypothetical protein M2C02_22595, partial [Klebsiella pneumoniae]|nr:hypothetical protein [Klebsiella pneumoniae]MDZ3168776.1 hypothetical protein [Klebsiella pneumoniae]
MLGFNQDEYLTSAREIIAARKQAETVADDIYDSGCSALFFASVGGSLAPMMAINEFAKELTSVPVYLEQAAELIHRGHKKLNKDAVVVTLSKEGANKQVISSQADSLIKISRIWADFFPANTSNQPI